MSIEGVRVRGEGGTCVFVCLRLWSWSEIPGAFFSCGYLTPCYFDIYLLIICFFSCFSFVLIHGALFRRSTTAS